MDSAIRPLSKHKRPCEIDGCERVAIAIGLCRSHYSRQHRGSTNTDLSKRDTPPPRTCSVEGCEKPHVALGYCKGHYTKRGKLRTGGWQ